MIISYIVLLISLNYFLRADVEEFFLKIGGTDSATCTSYESACGTIDYVMTEIVNKTEDSAVYVDNGTYNCTIVGGYNSASGGYSNRTFSVSGYILEISVDAFNSSTYPVILFDVNNTDPAFEFYMNINASFECVKFYTGTNSGIIRRIIVSFIYLFITIFCLLIYLLINTIFNL
jgi:hypothetical protein